MPIHEAAMWSAYQQTTYVAWLAPAAAPRAGAALSLGSGGVSRGEGPELAIRVGGVTPALDGLLDAHGARSWCFVTAANPGSEPLSEARNLQRNDVLKRELEIAGLLVFAGEGRGRDGRWPAEASFLVIGPDRAEATALGVRHGQNAIVFGERGGRAELIDCRRPGASPTSPLPLREAPGD